MAETPPLRYPDWQPKYQDAMMELDPGKLRQRILDAHTAISERLRTLALDLGGTAEERNAIADALNGLAMLELEVSSSAKRPGWNGPQRSSRLGRLQGLNCAATLPLPMARVYNPGRCHGGRHTQ
jgi:hypothetical protein